MYELYFMADLQYDYIELQLDSNYAKIGAVTGQTKKNNPLFVLGRQISNVSGVKVMEVEIPFSYYVLDGTPDATGSLNNRFVINQDGSSGQDTITIPPEQYTATTLVTALNALFAESAALTFAPQPIVSSFNVATGKLTFTCSGAGCTTFTIGVASGIENRPINEFLGFDDGVYTAAISGGAFVLQAPFVAQITGPNYLYINSQYLGKATKCYLPQGIITGQTNPQFAKVSVNCNPGGVITWSDPAPTYVFDTQNLFQLLNIDLYVTAGDSQTPIDFNGLGFSVKLALQINTTQVNEGFAGTTGQDRVSKRVRMI